jgi:hypothetical protein
VEKIQSCSLSRQTITPDENKLIRNELLSCDLDGQFRLFGGVKSRSNSGPGNSLSERRRKMLIGSDGTRCFSSRTRPASRRRDLSVRCPTRVGKPYQIGQKLGEARSFRGSDPSPRAASGRDRSRDSRTCGRISRCAAAPCMRPRSSTALHF